MHLRAPGPDDAKAVLEVMLARDRHDLGVPDFTLEDLHEEWSRTGFELASDAVICEDDEHAVIGYASVRRTHGLAVVVPAQEGRGIGTLLLGWLEARERELGREHHRQAIASTNRPGERLLLDAGYLLERSYSRMSRALDDLPPRVLVPGVTLRELDLERDAREVYTADAESFADSPDYVPTSFATFAEEHLEGHRLSPELSAVAETDGRLAGFLLAHRWPTEHTGFIAVLGVRPGQQSRGIGTALLGYAFERFAAAGLRDAQLGVASSNPRAQQLYERLGMRPRFRMDAYVRPVVAQAIT
jgi:mycothiol synthase